MQGIAEMFAELDGYDRYEYDLFAWGARRTAEIREYKRDWYAQNREKWNAYLRAYRGNKQRKQALHGTRSKYVGGCRCQPCKRGEANYRREYRAQRQAA